MRGRSRSQGDVVLVVHRISALEHVLQDQRAYQESDALHGWPVGPEQAPGRAVAGELIIKRQHLLCPSKGAGPSDDEAAN